jgi:pimeloyl-ACP methyl ester carboxylesterase
MSIVSNPWEWIMSDRVGRRESHAPVGLEDRPSPAARSIGLVILCTLAIAPVGCGGLKVSEPWVRNAIEDRLERSQAINHLSSATGAVLLRYDLLKSSARDPAAVVRILETKLEAEPVRDGALALAELSFQAGLLDQSKSRQRAMDWYRDAAALATLALEEPAGSRPDLAVRIHNGAVARLIRDSQAEASRPGRNWRKVLEERQIVLSTTAPFLNPQQIANLRVARDLRVRGMDHIYQRGGLGVPLVAHRVMGVDANTPEVQDVQDEFLPHDLRTGATAVMRPGGSLLGGEWRKSPSTLTLVDSFGPMHQPLGDSKVQLACDRTTPLAALLSGRRLAMLEWTGLFDSRFNQQGLDTALYMSRPYEPGKIPVIFVHGLVSSPRAWVQTINELENSPLIESRYQFWVFLYPTGLPIPSSARRLRESLLRVRNVIDPEHHDPALDRTVLIGHSMGGVLSKMMAQKTGSTLWDAAITVPQDRFKAPRALRGSLEKTLVFEPIPFVSRVVFIATPHRGSPIANGPIGWAFSHLMHRPLEQAEHIAEIEALNGPRVLTAELRGAALNAINSLRTDSPILAALDQIPIDAAVPYHSIIPLLSPTADSDGVVPYRSSHIDGAESEKIVTGDHSSQESPEVTREIRRILLEHLNLEPMVAQAAGTPDRRRE